MILKLIETNDTPNRRDLVKDSKDNLHIYENRGYGNGLGGQGSHFNNKHERIGINPRVVLPYGISDDELKEGDDYYSPYYDAIVGSNSATNIKLLNTPKYKGYKKVVMKPENFNPQDLVDLKLKDGDSLDNYYCEDTPPEIDSAGFDSTGFNHIYPKLNQYEEERSYSEADLKAAFEAGRYTVNGLREGEEYFKYDSFDEWISERR
jgi:hypothetical protein